MHEKGPGGHGIVGFMGYESWVAEFELLFIEITYIANLLNNHTNAESTDHIDTIPICHELLCRKALVYMRRMFLIFLIV